MYINECFKLMKVGVQNIVVATGDAEEEFGGIIRINNTGAFLWNLLEKECKREDLIAALIEEYDIDNEVAKRSVDSFLDSLRKEGVLVET